MIPIAGLLFVMRPLTLPVCWQRGGNRNWVFSTENKALRRVDSTAIVRHTKIKATANPFLDMAYFQKRKFDKGMHRLTGKFKTIWKNQNGLCYHCGMPMDVTEEREIFYLAPKAKTGVEDVRNMRYVHWPVREFMLRTA